MPSNGPMACPIDGATLVMSERQGIEIDYCPTCRGVWLDRGELDKLVERSMSEAPAPAPPPQAPSPGPSYDSRRSSYPEQKYDDRRRDSGYSKKRKKESFLGDLFDF